MKRKTAKEVKKVLTGNMENRIERLIIQENDA